MNRKEVINACYCEWDCSIL
ncbi:DUF3927 domain-containing protein [Algoriphagus ratkowskyi]|uniref:DUF3927 domain-containing protein n=1 Tax=Algoriphagus ratkowskyi TaxID=57028 RepID=A0ABY3HLZ8_9BACT|nr:DUF3927 domain-containing protein [Algoriphagus ratkowskyi]